MTSVAALVTLSGHPHDRSALEALGGLGVEPVSALALGGASVAGATLAMYAAETRWSFAGLNAALTGFMASGAEVLAWLLPPAPKVDPRGLRRLVAAAGEARAALAFGDYFDLQPDGSCTFHPLIDHQRGALRDDFDFGPLVVIPRRALAQVLESWQREASGLRWGAWYDLRLRLSEIGPVVRLSEGLAVRPEDDPRRSGEKVFDYVDPRQRDYQIEMERVATAALRRLGAWIAPPSAPLVQDSRRPPVTASVVIPVRNRARTVGGAARSALSQKTDFDFNVLVVDNHSDDGTTPLLAALAQEDQRLLHLRPSRRDLLIGGCWNEAIYSDQCGTYAVQLDSDDLYSADDVLQRLVGELQRGPYALVIGSYTTVDFDLHPRPPGLVDHREWSDENGFNNALRIHGLGAPRAFHVPTLRTLGFPNVSYGEDYAVALRLCRTWRVGRIYDSLYWCRRWEGNSDSALSVEMANRHHAYKDRLRTLEIEARRQLAGAPR
jgi:hypothetical protein